MSTVEQIQNQYLNAAIYFHDSDCVEYVRRDQFCVYERVDSFLTLVQDASGNLIGFKLKGFKNLFDRLRSTLELSENDFLPLISAIESIYTTLGNEFIGNRAQAYKAAYKLASNDNVRLDKEELRAA